MSEFNKFNRLLYKYLRRRRNNTRVNDKLCNRIFYARIFENIPKYKKIYNTISQIWNQGFASRVLDSLVSDTIVIPDISFFTYEHYEKKDENYIDAKKVVYRFLDEEVRKRFVNLKSFVGYLNAEINRFNRVNYIENPIIIRNVIETFACFLEDMYLSDKEDNIFARPSSETEYFTTSPKKMRGKQQYVAHMISIFLDSISTQYGDLQKFQIDMYDYDLTQAWLKENLFNKLTLPRQRRQKITFNDYVPKYEYMLIVLEYMLMHNQYTSNIYNITPPKINIRVLIEPLRKRKVIEYLIKTFKGTYTEYYNLLNKFNFEKRIIPQKELEATVYLINYKNNKHFRARLDKSLNSCVKHINYIMENTPNGYYIPDKNLLSILAKYKKRLYNIEYCKSSDVIHQSNILSSTTILYDRIMWDAIGTQDVVSRLLEAYRGAQAINQVRKVYLKADTFDNRELHVILKYVPQDCIEGIRVILDKESTALRDAYGDNFTYSLRT